MKRVALDFIRNLCWFWLAAIGIPTLAVLVLPFVGYAPYGDRPGPGWYGLPSGITWVQMLNHLKFVGGFLLLGVRSLPAIALLFILPFAVVRIVEGRIPLVATRSVGALLGAGIAWFTIANVGWYISIGWLAGGSGIAAGAFVGARCLPAAPSQPSQAAA
jgi:hypothetical protein